MARGSKEHSVSCRLASKGMRRSVSLTEIGFHFDDAPDHFAPDQQLSQQLLGDQVRGIQIKVPRDERRPGPGSSHELL